MKVMRMYRKMFKLSDNRYFEEKISNSFNSLLSLFDDEDADLVIKLLRIFIHISDKLSWLLIAVFPLLLAQYFIVPFWAHVIVMTLIVLLRMDRQKIKKNQIHSVFFYRTSTFNYLCFFGYFFLKYFITEAVFKSIIPYSVGLLMFMNHYQWFELWIVYSTVMCILVVLFYCEATFIVKNHCSGGGELLMRLVRFTEKQAHVAIKPVGLMYRYMYLNYNSIKMKVSIICLCAVLGFSLLLTEPYKVFLFIAINPLIVYLICTLIYLPNFTTSDYVRPTHYFKNKYMNRFNLIKNVFKSLVIAMKSYALIYCLEIVSLLNDQADSVAYILLLLNSVHCLFTIFLLTLRVHNVYFIQDEDKVFDRLTINLSTFVEDYFFLGILYTNLAPIILIIQDPILICSLYTCLIIVIAVYTNVKYELLKRR